MELQAFDFDGNGIADQVSVDTNGDMQPDVWRVDKDQDQVTDEVALDTDGDQVADLWVTDNSQNTIPDGVAFDLDRDGSPETYVSDVNENGVPDVQETQPWGTAPVTSPSVDPMAAETERQITASINTDGMIAGNWLIPGSFDSPPSIINPNGDM